MNFAMEKLRYQTQKWLNFELGKEKKRYFKVGINKLNEKNIEIENIYNITSPPLLKKDPWDLGNLGDTGEMEVYKLKQCTLSD